MGLGATLVTLVPNTIAHAADVNTSLTNLNATIKMYNGSDVTQVIGFNLFGSVNCGVYNFVNPVVTGGAAYTAMTLNNYFDGTNDRFMVDTTIAYQLWLNGSGLHVRKSTGATPVANANISWGITVDLYT